jgi:phage baseplate assembly protein gpV
MSLTAYTPQQSILNLQISLNGEISGLLSYLKKFECHYEFNKIPAAKLLFITSNPDTTSEEDQDESETISLNDELEIKINEGDDIKTLFKGIVYRIERNVGENCGFEIKVECKDLCMNLTNQQDVVPDETFETKMNRFLANPIEINKGSISIVNEVEMPFGSEEMVSKTSNTTPWDYIVSYLDALGLMTVIQEGIFKVIDLTADPEEPKYRAENGVNVFEFEGTQEPTVSNVIIRSWNPGTQEIEEQEDETNAENSEGNEVMEISQTHYSPETMGQMARARAAKNRLSGIKGKVRTFGNLQATYGDYIVFETVNPQIDGMSLLLSAVNHIIENGCWSTEYTYGLESNSSFVQNIRSTTATDSDRLGQSNTVNGLQIGVVTQIHNDPDNQFRIKVRIPAIANSGEGVWARLASLQAGPERGGFFIPEVHDEVVLGCFNNNPDTPVILGKLYSSARPAPFTPTEANFIQGLVSKEGTQVVLNDENKTVEITTQSKKKLIIGDDVKGFFVQDSDNGSTITVDDQGITLDSKGDITLKATGKIKIEGVEGDFSASGNMNLSGALINLN